jgi:hypothetical protein
MIITDQAAYSDEVFGLYWLLGYQFSPRPAGLPDQRFWCLDRNADYGPLNGLARNRINPELILAHWDDILRVLASLSTGTVRASELLRVLQSAGRPTPLGRAIAELGRAAKTLHLLHYVDNQLAALGFALNVLVLWNIQYMDDAVAHLRSVGREINDEHLARLSPLHNEHVLMLGTFPFTLPHELAVGGRRGLRIGDGPAWRAFLFHCYREAGSRPAPAREPDLADEGPTCATRANRPPCTT